MKNEDFSVSTSCINDTILYFSSPTQDALPNQDCEKHTLYQHVLLKMLSYKLIAEAFHLAEYGDPALHERHTYNNHKTNRACCKMNATRPISVCQRTPVFVKRKQGFWCI